MLFENLIGKVVRLLWHDIPYVGFFLTIDHGKYIVLTDCKRYSNLTLCFDKAVSTTDQQVDFIRLSQSEIRWITAFGDFVQVPAEFNNSAKGNCGKALKILHCFFCYKPEMMIPNNQEGAPIYTLLGNPDVALPDNLQVMQAFINNLPNNCWRCAGGNLTVFNSTYMNPVYPPATPMPQNNPQFQQGPRLVNAYLMEGVPPEIAVGLPPVLQYLAVNNNNRNFPPPATGFFGTNVGVNPMHYYNPGNAFPPVVQAFPMNFDAGNSNIQRENPVGGYPTYTLQNDVEIEYLPPSQLPLPNNDEVQSGDNGREVEENDETDDEENGEQDPADPAVIPPSAHEQPQEQLRSIRLSIAINVENYLSDRAIFRLI